MVKIFLSFSEASLEKQYQDNNIEMNRPAAQRLLFFNLSFHLALGILSMVNSIYYIVSIICFCNIPLICLFYFLCLHYTKLKIYAISLTIYVFCSILIPFAIFSRLLLGYFPLKNEMTIIDIFTLGFYLEMYVSHVYLFKMNWVIVIFLKSIVSFYIFIMDFLEHGEQAFILLVLTFISFIFDYQKEKNDRQNFLNAYMLKQHFTNFKKILENIPDQILIYQKKGLIFANEPSFQLFQGRSLEIINENINKNFEIQNQSLEAFHEENIPLSLNSSLWYKIQKIFDSKIEVQTFVANEMKNNIIDRNIEYDVVLKKIFWENELSIMVLFSKVNEKNMKARLNFVNSFLTLVLGNVSHEINTPIHIIQGNLENLKQEFKKEIPNEMKIIKRFIEILNIMMEIMIDLFNIRKGDLYLNLSKIQTNIVFKGIVTILEECFPYKKIRYSLKNIPTTINTDLRKIKNIFIFILNKLVQKIEEGDIEISFIPVESSCCKFYKILIICKGKIKTYEGELLENESLKNSRSISPTTTMKETKKNKNYDFYLINPLIFSLSSGSSEIIDEKNSTQFTLEKEKDIELADIAYSFKICDVGKHDIMKLKDPFREKHHFSLHFIHPDFKNFENIDERKPSEISLKIPENSDKKKNLKILNVDDMLFSLLVISNYCHLHKLFVEEAKNGLEACQAVENLSRQSKTFDLIFMDIDMPIMNGLEASKKINELLEEKNMKKSIIIAITANSTNEDLIKSCESNGITEVFKKPLSLDNFEEIIKKHLHV